MSLFSAAFSVHFLPLLLPALGGFVLALRVSLRTVNEGQGHGLEDGCCQLRLLVRTQLPPPAPGMCDAKQEEWERGGVRGDKHSLAFTRHVLALPPELWLLAQKREERCPCWPARWKVTGPQSSLGTGVGAWGSMARECCPRRAVSLGRQGRIPGPWTAWSCLCHLGQVRDTFGDSVSLSACPNRVAVRARVMWKAKGRHPALCPGGFITKLLLYG